MEVNVSAVVYIGWPKKGFLERWCERRVYAFLQKKCKETNISVIFIPANPIDKGRPSTLTAFGGSGIEVGAYMTPCDQPCAAGLYSSKYIYSDHLMVNQNTDLKCLELD
jgi:hypothetical protein